MSILRTIKDTLVAIMSKRVAIGCIVKQSKLASRAYISAGTRFYGGILEDISYIGRNGYFFKTHIGKFSSIGDMCYCGMPEHEMTYVSTSPAFCAGKNRMKVNLANLSQPKYKETKIGNDVWIGACVSIKAGVNIGDGAVIGMGSIVTHDIPPYSIAAGIPARVIRKRFSDDISEKLTRIAWWNWNDREIQDRKEEFADASLFVSKYSTMAEEKCE